MDYKKNLKILLSAFGGGIVGYLASPISAQIMNNALLEKIESEVKKLKVALNSKQLVIYNKIEQRVIDLGNFREDSDNFNIIKEEVYMLKDELTSTMSKTQMKSFTTIEDLELTLTNRLNSNKKASVALGGVLGLAIGILNNNKK